MEIALVSFLAVVVLPFFVGWWVGNPLFAALAFLALAVTVALGAAGRGDGAGDPGMGLALSLALSAVSAAAGGWVGQKRRARRTLRR